MGDNKAATLAKARRELEDLYLGIPDESVNLTFKDFAQIKPPPPQPTTTILEPVPEISSSSANKHDSTTTSSLHKLPSLDFSKVLRESNQNQPHHHHHYDRGLHQDHRNHHHHHKYHHGGGRAISPEKREEFRRAAERRMAYDDVSVMSMSMASGYPRDQNKAQRRRPGIPHTNICTICTTYIYIFRHRCLVCGRVYCRDCVGLGMGEMTEGRKCIHCLGRRFSQRYLKRAGNVGCCSRYPSTVKQAELRWAEKGPRRSGERAYGGGSGRSSVMMSRLRSPVSVQGTPAMAHASASYYSPYNISPTHHLPI
ncbi:hypothetical protein Ddye_019786 [Dipteronia dyeriana]|uniref:Uncharacterized protein n=1 Tax=Dipteronia dyeriana TaxID=168575 RepID=A0AAD9TYL8_9ROSI|nr:hypothetical protein Ddye_019786 [Dipteronia dyeriana]